MQKVRYRTCSAACRVFSYGAAVLQLFIASVMGC